MITVKEVSSKKEQKEFLDFPLKLYEDNPNFTPPLYMDEKKIFKKNYTYSDCCDTVYFNAYKDGVMAGRISGILQYAANEKNGEKRIRFTRFDAVDDPEVTKALFEKLEAWAIEKGMDTVCGPLGFSDLEREGLLIEGFDKPATFEEQYNAPYYQAHIEALGYEKEVDWLESEIRVPKEKDPNIDKMADLVMKRYKLHWGPAKNVNDFIDRYGDRFFALLDTSYDKLYGTVPFTDAMKKEVISNFKLIVDLRFVAVILDENDELVALGICFPALNKALHPSKGKLTPAALVRLLKALKKPEVIDFGLVGIKPEYLNRGITACFISGLYRMMEEEGIEHAETNLNLEYNYPIRNMWKRFDAVEHKRRRSYVKKLGTEAAK